MLLSCIIDYPSEPEMVNIQKLATRLAKKQGKLKIAQAKGKLSKAARLQGAIVKLQFKIQKAQAKAGVTQIGVGIGIQQTGISSAGVGMPGLSRATKVYSCSLKKGSIQYVAPSGQVRTLGYTPATAKKKYKTRRRRKRLTQRDRAIINAMATNPQAAGSLGLML